MNILGAPKDQVTNYNASKVRNWSRASELAHSVSQYGIISITQNPGNLNSNLMRHISKFVKSVVRALLHEPKMGAYTELYAGLSPDVKVEMSGGYVVPWERMHQSPRNDFLDALKSVEEGGTGGRRGLGSGVRR